MIFDSEDDRMEYEERCLLLRHFVRNRRIMAAVADRVHRHCMFEMFTDLNIIWECVYFFWDELKELIPEDVLLAEFRANAVDELSSEALDECMAMIRNWYARADFSERGVQKKLNEFFEAQALFDLREGMTSDELALEEQRELLDEARKELSMDAFSRPILQDPFEQWEDNIAESVRKELGMPIIDDMLEGGPCVGDLIGLLAPSKGGKTLIGMQIAQGVVGMKEHVVYISGEQALKGDLMIRLCCLASGEARDVFGKGVNRLPAEARLKVNRAKDVWSKYFHFVDMSGLDFVLPDIETMFQPVQDAIDSGVHPRLVVIDWWGCFKDKLVAANESRSDAEQRRLNRTWLMGLKQHTVKYGVVGLVLHQLKGAERSRSAKTVASSTAAQEDSNFDNRMDFCFVVGAKSQESMVQLALPTARSTGNSVRMCKMDGPHCQLIPASPEMAAQSFGSAMDTAPELDVKISHRARRRASSAFKPE